MDPVKVKREDFLYVNHLHPGAKFLPLKMYISYGKVAYHRKGWNSPSSRAYGLCPYPGSGSFPKQLLHRFPGGGGGGWTANWFQDVRWLAANGQHHPLKWFCVSFVKCPYMFFMLFSIHFVYPKELLVCTTTIRWKMCALESIAVC